MKKFAMMVCGCKVNDYEATYLRNKMLKEFEEVSFSEVADIYIVFTCCVTNVAESKTRKYFHRARRTNPAAYIVAIGCLSQIKGDSSDFSDVDLIIGSDQKDKIMDYIHENVHDNKVNKEISTAFEDLYFDEYLNKSRAFLKIQDGCNQFCSYCIIPYARGRERSGNHETLLAEAKKLAANAKEVVLSGIHTGRYNDGEYKLYDLLKAMIDQKIFKTIRLSSIEMNEVTDEIIELMATGDVLAHHLHIPIQAGSDEILALMHRPYTIKQYQDRIEYIRWKVKDVSISTDLIVGFPNESDELFEKSMETIQKIGFSFVHVFPYSRKSGTAADLMSGHIDPKTKKDRVRKAIAIQDELSYAFNSKFIGKTLLMLNEKTDGKYSYGYVKQYFYVRIKGSYPIGELLKVRIIKVDKDWVEGEYVTE
ncbi:MAG: tRNA (N(6)-L-threonylcarbamoyladenosine(37)-C(2))-methylthiotransferase MtaB [Erysipelotrichaceae bacterium]|nr:tRNA (N(6)-L-threonylcarbamoyladenosine(37)-C(2))-methylthiotransferase MtaB [Erysipelotrichaceae bacterium]